MIFKTNTEKLINLKIFLIDDSNETFYIATDDVDILLSSVLVLKYIFTLLSKKEQKEEPVDSIIFLIITLGNDYTGSIYGLTYELILNTFLSNPINLIEDSPQLNTYLDFLKVVYYQKNKAKLRSTISMFSTKQILECIQILIPNAKEKKIYLEVERKRRKGKKKSE